MTNLPPTSAVPLFDYTDTARIERLIGAIVRLSLGILAAAMLIVFLLQGFSIAMPRGAYLLALLASATVFLIAALLVRLRQVLVAALFLPASMWVLISALVFFTGGMQSPGFVFYAVVAVLAAMLTGVGAGGLYLLLMFLISAGFVYAEQVGWLPSPILNEVTAVEWALAYGLSFLWAMGLIYINVIDLRRLLLHSRQSEEALKENNRELHAMRVSLQNYARSLERRVVHLQVAAEIAREATLLDKMDDLLNRAVTLVRDRFGFYHAGIFLVENDYAVLRAATGEAGAAMLAAQHQLKVGEVGIVGYVTGTGQPRIALDVGTDAAYFRNPYLPETRSEMAVPLQVGRQIIGALDVQSRQANAFHSEDIAILQTLSDQLAIAIENARLYESAQRRLDELTTLHAVALAAAEATSQDELIERATQLIGEKLYPNNFGILLVDDAAGVLRFHPSYRGLDDALKQVAYPVGQGVIGRVAADGRVMRVSEVTRQPAYLDIHAGMQSELCVPLNVGGQVIGVINAEHTRSGAFTQADERLLLAFSGQLATAIEKVRLFELATRRAAALEALRQAGLSITANLEVMAVFEAILQHTVKLVQCDSARIYRYDGKTLIFGTALGRDGKPHGPIPPPRPQGLTYTVARTGQRMVVSDVTRHALFANLYSQGALAGLPLRCGEDVIGVMNIVFEKTPHHFDAFELHVLELLADSAAIALTNAQLYADAQERARALSLALAEREELDRLKDELIQNVSHELRTPVAIIRGYADLLAQEELGALLPEQADAVAVIARRVTLLGKIVDDLTTMMETEARPAYRESVQLAELVQRVVQDFHTSLANAGLTLALDLPRQAPLVQGNAAHLTRLVDNLIGNAIKFTPVGGTIGVSLSFDQAVVQLQVCDSGVGIPSDKLTRIFDRFYQVDGSTTRRYGGTGLGLALVKEIAVAHGGQVSVESEVGRGSTFTITLPLEGALPIEAAQTRILDTSEK
jgi:signal transduction histidine kinase